MGIRNLMLKFLNGEFTEAEFKVALEKYLGGDMGSLRNKLFLKKEAMTWFYGPKFKKICNAIDKF